MSSKKAFSTPTPVLLGNGPLALDHFTLRPIKGAGIVYVHAAWLDPVSGQPVSYEVGLLPRMAASTPTLSVPACLIQFEGQQGLLPPDAFQALLGGLRASSPWPPPGPLRGALCA